MLLLFPEGATQEGGNNYGKDPLSAYKATSYPNTLYHHEVMKADDRKEFLLPMIKEVTDKINNGSFSLIRRGEIPEGSTLLPGLWQAKRKRYIKIRQINRWKSRLNVDSLRMSKWMHYEKV